jgi:hypothetical protein
MLRADYRGNGKISAYQVMSIIAMLFAICLQTYLPEMEKNQPNLLTGLKQLWDPAWIVFIQVLWLTVFFYLGRSRITRSTITIDVQHDMI